METQPDNTGDRVWMQHAIAEARKGIGLTSPNPSVGAAIVRDGVMLGKGWHTRAGQPHAEREAIADALAHHPADSLRGATIYVTLEPCSSHGRTPPCTKAILDAGISRVVYGTDDPNPAHAGRAKALLRAHGVHVTSGVCGHACQDLIRPFAKVQRTGMPWVILKSAVSLDGRITRPPGEGQWLTSPESRELVQTMRHQADAIMTGGNTLRRDNPALTVRSPHLPPKEQPWRMIVTRSEASNLPPGSQVFTDTHAHRTLVQSHGDLPAALQTLASHGCNTVLVEAGGKLMGALLDAGLADEIAIFYAPMLTGGPDAGFSQTLKNTPLTNQTFQRIGNDILLRATILKT